MSDLRHRNNLTTAQRRKIVAGTRRKARARKTDDQLQHAMNVLRRHGKDVFRAEIDQPRFAGSIYVGTRRYSWAEVIEMAREIEESEKKRNLELRARHGLPAKK